MPHTLNLPIIESTLLGIFHSTFALYWQTHSAHWNIVSPDFYPLHELLEKQYNGLWEALDEIAERLRSLGLSAPTEIVATQALPFGSTRNEYLGGLLRGHETIISELTTGIETLEAAGDIAGADFLTERLAEQQKMHWMLLSSI